MERFVSLFRRIFPVLLFVIALLPRAVQPVSRPLVWYLRSAHFIEAVLAGDWANTVYSEHPGVVLMWPAGIGLKVYWTLSGITPAAHAVPPDFEPIHFFGPVPVAEIAAAVAPLALLVALGIAGIYLMLRRLFDEATAAVAGLLLALSPYYLAQSKILHLEALLATLMLLSALALLLYRRERGELHRTRWLLLSGVLGGLALLVKTPALFLVPFSGMVLLVDAIGKSANRQIYKSANRQIYKSTNRQIYKSAIRNLQSAICNFFLWLFLAALVYVALWPAMWVDPGRGLAAVRWGLTHHASTAHDTPTFFLGRVLREDPGPLFYGVTLLFRTGEVELTFLAVAVVLGTAQCLYPPYPLTPLTLRRRRISSVSVDQAGSVSVDVDGLLLAAYAVFFLAQMSLGAKKMPRYVLPALLALDVLAAAGMVAWARGLASVLSLYPLTRGPRRWLWPHPLTVGVLILLPLLVQAALVLPRHPYYGTTFNWLAGGPPAAARAILIGEEGEGLAELAAILNDRPDVERLTVAAQLRHVFNQTFRGTTVDIDWPTGQPTAQGGFVTTTPVTSNQPTNPPASQPSVSVDADYLVFHRNYTVRDYKVQQWGAVWERYAARTPEQEIGFDGVPYAWLYPALPADAWPEHPLPVRLDDRYRFLGYDLRSAQVAPGDRISLVLYWQATEPVTDDLSVFVHLLDPAGGLVWQEDGAAAHGTRPTSSWAPGEVVADPHTVALPFDLPEGDYLLTAGLYDWRTGERLPAVGMEGIRLPEDRLSVDTLAVRWPRTNSLAWLARGLASLVILLSWLHPLTLAIALRAWRPNGGLSRAHSDAN